jgi:predicted ATPase
MGGRSGPGPQPTDFLGRREEVAALVDLVGRTRLVTLVGAGGVGKTRLGLEVAAQVAEGRADGVRVVELAPVPAGSTIVEAVAGSLGITAREAAATTLDAVVDWLEPRDVLVVLDNCEHVLDAVRRLVEPVLRSCPRVDLLLTSREALDVDGEHRWLTRPLPVPPPGTADPFEAEAYEAITLFVARAAAASRDFVLDTGNVEEVAAICRRLDGIPLALELAAARLPALGPADLLAHLDERFRLLGSPGREARRTLRGTVDWSHNLLDDAQRVLFRRLTVFAGGWSLAACQDVCAGGELSPAGVVGVLAELAAKSLVTVDAAAGGTRYHMLETLRTYGRERLDEAGEGDAFRRRHARWAAEQVAATAPGLKHRDERASGDRLHTELANLRTALRWAITDLDAELAFGLVGGLENYAILRLDFEVAAWAEEALAAPAWADHPRRHLALGLVGHAAWARGEHERAQELGREALDLEDRHGGPPSWAARQAVADGAWFRGRVDEALAHFEDWVADARRLGDDFDLSWALAHLSVAELFGGRGVRRRELAEEALALARRCGSPFLIALALYAISEAVIEDDPAAALRLVTEGATIGRDSGNRFAYGLCLTTAASLTGRLGDPVEALDLYRSAVENWQIAGNWSNQRILLRNLAEHASRIGRHELTPRLLGGLTASGEMLPHAAGTGGRGAGQHRPHQPRDRDGAVHLGAHRRHPHQPHPPQARHDHPHAARHLGPPAALT